MNNCRKYIGLITESMQSYIDKALEKFDLSIKKVKDNVPADVDFNTTSRKIQLMSEDGTRLGEGVILPSSDWGGNIDTAKFARTEDIPTKMSQLTNDNNYVTESNLVDKGYLTSHQDISGKVDKVEGKQLTTNDYDDTERNRLKNLYDNQLTDTIMINGKLYLVKKDGAVIGEGTTISNDTTDELVDYAKKNEVANDLFLNSSTNRLQLIDTTGKKIGNGVLLPVSNGTGGTGSDVDLSNYATISQLNEKVDKITGKQLTTNDYDNIEKNKVKDLYNNKIIKTIIDNGKLYLVNSNGDKIDSGTVLPKNSSTSTGETVDLSEYAKISQLPTKTSQLSNDSGFLTSIPSNYVTDEKLNNKGYLTSHQDLSSYSKKTDTPNNLSFNSSTNTLKLINSNGTQIGSTITLPTSSQSVNVDLSKIAITCDDKLPSETSDYERIQRAIDGSDVGDIILFPQGNVEIHRTIELKPNRTYIGSGWGGSIKASNNANLAEMIRLPHSTNNYRTIIDNIRLDGNKDNNGANTGLYIGSAIHSVFKNIYATYCKGTGIYIDGNTSWRSNTTDIINCRVLGCGGYGLYISEYCEDMHILQGDYGSNQASGIYIKSPSSSIRDVTCWGNMSNGIWIDINAVCVQVWNSQIEGNSQNGIFIEGAFAEIIGNKVYDNANIPANYGKFDGIYVNAYKNAYENAPMKGVSIIGNKVYSGLYENTGLQRFALSIDQYHEGFSIFGNDFFYQGNGTIDKSRSLVNGLNETDKSDYNWINTFVKLNLSSNQTITNSTLTRLLFTSVTDIDGNFDSTTSRIKIKEDGYYRISCIVHIDNCIENTYCYLQYNINNTVKSRIASGYGGSSTFLTINGEDIVYMKKDDIVDVDFYASQNVTLNRTNYLSSITFSKYVM